ncbi:MAG TPA: methyltransferase domain-containing protein [Actinomycetota bacterium]|nr:methyltransferase domain-containing protein [Actinomycetota bacterium]
MPVEERILRHYEEEQREEERLLRGAGRLEFLRTLSILERCLPATPASILDIGGGSGVYAIPLAARGYEVHLVDPVRRHLNIAKQYAAQNDVALASVSIGDARRLVFDDGSADCALLLGPLYHLTERNHRLLALQEARRVLRTAGVLVVAAISRFASLYDSLMGGFIDQPGFEQMLERDLTDGRHLPPADRTDWFTNAYFHLPEELKDELVQASFDDVKIFAVEGPGWVVPDLDERLDEPTRRERLLRLIARVELEPSILGASAHVVAVARRP